MDGHEALRMLRGASAFDFMLLDVNMPGMSGLECVKELREACLQPAMKVMMVTTEADNSYIRQALDYRESFDVDSAATRATLMRFPEVWLAYHILFSDKELAAFLARTRIKPSAR